MHHAAATPITAQRSVTATVSRTVFQSSVPSGAGRAAAASVAPADCTACSTRKTSGSSTAATTTVPAPSRRGGAGRRDVVTSRELRNIRHGRIGQITRSVLQQAGLAQQSDRAAPFPSCVTVIGSGRSVANGTSGLAVTTPEPSGYS